MKTECFICIPVINNDDQVVAVMFAFNKLQSAVPKYFTDSDLNLAHVNNS
jgi:hypothetical protein